LGIELGRCSIEVFPDDELYVVVGEDTAEKDVYVFQPTDPPVSERLLEMLLIGDACKRAGASRTTAVMPYFGYARQDRRTQPGEPISARLVAGLLGTQFDRVVTVDLHNSAIEGFFTIPVEHLSAVPLLAQSLKPRLPKNAVLVAPDLGAVKLAHRYAELLDLPVAYVHKVRLSGREVEVRQIMGEVAGRSPVLVDDMISTAGTMASSADALLKKGCTERVTIVASHALLVDDARKRLTGIPVERVVTTDSVHHLPDSRLVIETVSLGDLLAGAIRRLHEGINRRGSD
jgi:ribose-phosphate pyrophosphokinase